LGLQVGHVTGPCVKQRSAVGSPTGQRERELANRTCGDLPMMSDETKPVAVPAENGGIERIAQAGGTLCNRVEHGLNIRGRTSNHTEDLAGRRLLFQRLL